MAVTFMVVRTDDNGRTYMVVDGLESAAVAQALHATLTERAHKQDYAVLTYESPEERAAILALWDVQE